MLMPPQLFCRAIQVASEVETLGLNTKMGIDDPGFKAVSFNVVYTSDKSASHLKICGCDTRRRRQRPWVLQNLTSLWQWHCFSRCTDTQVIHHNRTVLQHKTKFAPVPCPPEVHGSYSERKQCVITRGTLPNVLGFLTLLLTDFKLCGVHMCYSTYMSPQAAI